MSLPVLPTIQPITHHHHHHHHGGDIYNRGRRGSSAQNSTSSLSDDEDAITPCPVERTGMKQIHLQQPQPQPQTHQHQPQTGGQRPKSWRDDIHADTLRHDHLDGPETETHPGASTRAEDVDAETLWRRMLAIQRVFGCYNSARMRAALDMGGDGSGFIPSRTCLDLLNDSIDQLPEESKRQLEEYLETGEPTKLSRSSTTKRRSWRQRLLHGPPLLNGF